MCKKAHPFDGVSIFSSCNFRRVRYVSVLRECSPTLTPMLGGQKPRRGVAMRLQLSRKVAGVYRLADLYRLREDGG
jgi:hypothetical protein